MISVVIATYNGSKYIEKQLDTLRLQSMPADEIIIVDDCSTDDTTSIIRDFIYKNNLEWRLYINEKNKGYKNNFYYGISLASGDYIFLCDQDDEWELNKIQVMIDVMRKNPTISALNCGVTLINGLSEPIKYKKTRNYYNCNFLYSKDSLNKITYFDLAYIMKHNISPGCSMVITSEIKKIFLITYDYRLPHDWHLNMIASVKNQCAFLNEVLIKYRRHENNVIGANTSFIKGIKSRTRNFRIEDYLSRIESAKRILKYYGRKENNNEKSSMLLLMQLVDFYRNPSIKKLINLRQIKDYYEVSKHKVRLWEIAVALHFDTFFDRH